MFGWFRAKAVCPVDGELRAWIDGRWAWLQETFGSRRLHTGRLILPRPEFFPDAFDRTQANVRRMLDRVCGYMDIDPALIEISFFSDRNPVHEGSFAQRTTGQCQAEAGRFRIWIEESNLDEPLAMVGALAREIGHVHLLGPGRTSEEDDDLEPLAELLTVFFGMGIFTANSVIREHYWHAGEFAGWTIGRRGHLGMRAYGYALARFAAARGENGSAWASELRLDVRAAFQQSLRLLAQEGGTPRV